jgi:hypothetical protein
MAWAWGEVLDDVALDAKLVEYNGIVRRPSAGDGLLLACPKKGSFESLERRYQAPRFRTKSGQRVFVQQQKPSYRQISYESPPVRHLFELRSSGDSERRVAWPLEVASSLVVAAREAARGHAEGGAPIRRSHSSHLSFAFEPDLRRLLILAPHVVERRAATPQELDHLRTLDSALEGFCELRAGHAGILSLSAAAIRERAGSLLGISCVWKTITPYVVTRHAKGGTATEAVVADVLTECHRLRRPEPRVQVNTIRGAPGIGLTGNVTLLFRQRVAGPLLLGRTRHFGGGLFRPVAEPDQP